MNDEQVVEALLSRVPFKKRFQLCALNRTCSAVLKRLGTEATFHTLHPSIAQWVCEQQRLRTVRLVCLKEADVHMGLELLALAAGMHRYTLEEVQFDTAMADDVIIKSLAFLNACKALKRLILHARGFKLTDI